MQSQCYREDGTVNSEPHLTKSKTVDYRSFNHYFPPQYQFFFEIPTRRNKFTGMLDNLFSRELGQVPPQKTQAISEYILIAER